MTRTYARLLGPCFKTGRIGGRLSHRKYLIETSQPARTRHHRRETKGNKIRRFRMFNQDSQRTQTISTPLCSRKTAEYRPIRQLYPFPSQWFHALLNSLFKVLCNFPSRYLFAIGLAVLFSLRWSLPPNSGCVLRQPDSKEQPTTTQCNSYRSCTFSGLWPQSKGL